MTVYHFTDTARLPHILLSGALVPGRSTLGGFPDPDFLWATLSPHGDRTSTGYSRYYREGQTRLVRIGLHDEDFRPWRDAVGDFPQWTDDHISRLEASAAYLSVEPRSWLIRSEPLSADRFVSIDTRSFTTPWLPLVDPKPFRVQDGAAALEIAGFVYASMRVDEPGAPTAYACSKRAA